MERKINIKYATGTSAFLFIGLLAICYSAGVMGQFLAFSGVWALLILSAFIKPNVSFRQLSVAIMYLLVASTFLNQSFLSIEVGFFTLFLYRLLLIAAVCIFLVHIARDRMLPRYWSEVQVKGVMLFLLFWLAYACVSLVWAKSVIDGIKYIFLLGIGILFVFLAVFTFKSLTKLWMVYILWMLMSIPLMIVGLMNHFLHIQLPSSTLYGGPEYKLGYPTSVFYNQNDFATFLTISFFFYLVAAKNCANGTLKTIMTLLVLLSGYLIYLTESRASLLALFAGLLLYLFLHLPKVLKKLAIYLAAAAVVVGAILIFIQFEKVFGLLFLSSGYQPKYEPLASNVSRINLLKNTLHYLGESLGFGVGAGNISYYLKNNPLFHTNYVVEVHNWLAEILGNFGILVFFGYVLMYGYLFFSLYKLYGLGGGKIKVLLEACLLAMAAFLVSSISPSTMINLYFHWVFLGFVISVVSVIKSLPARELSFSPGNKESTLSKIIV
ncbi:teichuronic acid biosynthesis protein TuaE [Bacillus sp. FJAT-18017]|uniref:teichuronic acid biosynthesis protein TuaE n=1 Tax=Bacillus sp. FJAT-18017 TaxID=1705566 RepID=UPI0006AEC6C2|nr:O-antigen ligase family protein [Bacillus sp. FJAT-18017]